jgi:flagellar basal-body rod protein FlgF
MDRLIYTAMTGASQTMSRLASVGHNIANASTTGYRAEEHRLRAVPIQSQALPTRAFAVDASTYNDYSAGPQLFTGRPLDMAVQGSGWIAVQMPDGSEAYTRNGSFQLDVNGVLQTRNGLPIMGGGGPISIPPDSKINVGRDGIVSLIPETGSQSTVNAVGRIKLVNPAESDLVRGADGLFRMQDGSAAPPVETVALAGGYLEGSNVNPVEQMVSMIALGRQFEMQMKALTTADSNDRAAAQVLGNF